MAFVFRLGRGGFRGATAAALGAAAGSAQLADRHQPRFWAPVPVMCAETTKSMRSTSETAKSMNKTLLYKAYERRYGLAKNVQMGPKDVAELLAVIGVTDQFMVSRIFRCMDDDMSGSISPKEMLAFCKILGSGNRLDRMKFVFSACDTNANGKIEQDDLRNMIRHLILNLHRTQPEFALVKTEEDAAIFADFPPEEVALMVANRLAFEIFKAADKDKSGFLDLKEFLFWFSRNDKNAKALSEIFGFFDILVAE